MSKTLGKPKQMNGVLLSFLLGMAGALAIFLPFLVVDKGFFVYAGDYNLQQIPFYMYVQQFIKTGGGTWSWSTDLGSSVINSYSFYNIGSPFLWLSLIFPSRWMPFAMVPLFIVKFGSIAAAANLYLSRYARNRNTGVICSLVYAFCGFNVYNIFFNHMLDPVVLFPLILWALDGFVYDKKRGFLAVFIGLALLNSYFFFIGNVVFVLLYFVVKVATKEYVINVKEFGLLALEALLGLGIGMILALPAYLNLVQNPRTNDFANGFNLVVYWHAHQYFNIITSMFLPPDPPYLPNLFTEGAIKWTSMSAFLPIVSIAGVIAYWKARKRSAVKLLLGICFLMAMVPILNSSFYAFNASYYARWYYMPLLIMTFATLRSLEDSDIDLVGGAKWALILTSLYAIFGLLPTKKDDVWVAGVAQSASKFWLTVLTAVLGSFIFYILVKFYRHKERFTAILLSAVMGFSVFYSVVHLSLGKFPWYEANLTFRPIMYDGSAELEMPDDGFYRMDTFSMEDNFSLWSNTMGLQTFNSVVTPSIMEFYPFVGVKRDVSSKPETKYYALRGLLSVQYTLTPIEKRSEFENDEGFRGWQYYKEQGPFVVYENENFVPLGFTYDRYITMDTLNSLPADDRSPLLMRAIGLDDQQRLDYGHLFESEIPLVITGGGQKGKDEFQSVDEAIGFDFYVEDCRDRRESASYETSYDASGFRCKIDMSKENLVFFGVPYDPGFSATVNGQPVRVLKVSGGMMAVQAPAGNNEIVFRYQTPGFMLGASITILSISLLCLYLVLCMYFAPKNKQEATGKKGTAKKKQGKVKKESAEKELKLLPEKVEELKEESAEEIEQFPQEIGGTIKTEEPDKVEVVKTE